MAKGVRETLSLSTVCISGDYLLEAWFLLINGIFLFMASELGLGGIHDLLGYVVVHNLYPNIFHFSEDELFFFRDFDQRSGLEPVIADCYKEIPNVSLHIHIQIVI